jgi:hypothetical protein
LICRWNQFEAIHLAAEHGQQAWWQRFALARSQSLEPLSGLGLLRPVMVDPLGRKKGADAVDMGGALLDQPRALAVRPLGVFLFGGRHPDHTANEAIASLIGDQDPQELTNVEAVGLGAP